jgi:predicted Na+-dependent transporter
MSRIFVRCSIAVLAFLALQLLILPHAYAENNDAQKEAAQAGEKLYEKLILLSKEGKKSIPAFDKLGNAGRSIDWKNSEESKFTGNTRLIKVGSVEKSEDFYLIREINGRIHLLVLPEDKSKLEQGADSYYADIKSTAKYKMEFSVKAVLATIDGESFSFVKLSEKPERNVIDRLFFIAVVLLLFLTMIGMGLTLTLTDFALVFKKPLGMLVGIFCQFGLLPALAMVVGKLSGFYESVPFIYLGLILIASSPGGVTSNLMTYLGKGDVALSISLTALCTALSIFFTPLLLTIYASAIPQFSIPVGEVAKTMLILVIVPLFIGMVVRGNAEKFAKKAEKPFAIIGIFALLFLIIVGIWTNLANFADTDRYGLAFYLVVFLLTFLGMILSGFLSKLVKIANFQVRAISLECGLRNASLAMAIAILLQDQIGDFSSSMFFTAAIFGLSMYVAGAISIFVFPKVLPVKTVEKSST